MDSAPANGWPMPQDVEPAEVRSNAARPLEGGGVTDTIPPFDAFNTAFDRIAEAADGTHTIQEIGALASHAALLVEQSGQATAIDGVVGMVRVGAAGRRAQLKASS